MANDIFADEAKTKFGKEFSLVESIADHLVLNDAEVKVEAASIDGLGFGKKPGAVLKFSVPPQLAAQQENVYRDSAEEHATKFAKTFNANMVERKPDGSALPFTMQPIAQNNGSEVTFDLGLLRNVLSQHAVADVLPKISEQYSVSYMAEKLAAQAPRIVQQTLMQRQAEKQQAKQEDKILGAVEKVLENPAYIGELVQTDPQLIAVVQQNIRNFAGVAAQAASNPDMLKSVREQNPRIADIVEKIMEQQKERPVASPVAEPETTKLAEPNKEKQKPEKKKSFVEAENDRAEKRSQEKGAALG